MNEDEELSSILEKKINRLAATFYQMNGRKFLPDLDFRNSSHPEEYGCWNRALVSYAWHNEDDWYLQFQR